MQKRLEVMSSDNYAYQSFSVLMLIQGLSYKATNGWLDVQKPSSRSTTLISMKALIFALTVSRVDWSIIHAERENLKIFMKNMK